MFKSICNILITVFIALVFGCSHAPDVNPKIHTFYYNWYGNDSIDGKMHHWSHDIIPHWSDSTGNNLGSFPGGESIGANFYPELGCYSSNDPALVEKHMQMIKDSGVGVLSISWWGIGSYEDKSVPLYLEKAHKHGLEVAFHIEPFYKSPQELKKQLEYLAENYLDHPAIFKHDGLPFYYVYDSYKLEESDWAKLLVEGKDLSVRGTGADANFIGLWVHDHEHHFFQHSGFDGFYTYFASDGFVWGSSKRNWPSLSRFAKQNDLIFIPCVGPGYLDTRIRPWNDENTRPRNSGKYYETMFRSAVNANPDFIGITSFNEWHEGTQIEPAIRKKTDKFIYEDYENQNPDFYLKLTKEFSESFKN